MENLTGDERFLFLLHKKIMHKRGSTRRRAKKYYLDQYRKSGIIPEPLLLAGKGIMEGRKCSGRRRSIEERIKNRFIEMVKASCDHVNQNFIFISRRTRTIKNYSKWLEEEFGHPISLTALRRLVKAENLRLYLEKPDYDDDEKPIRYSFKAEPVFDLIQVDGCKLHYFQIRDQNGEWQKPQVIEFYDTGSRYMLVLDLYFSESSLNGADLFKKFLLSTPFAKKKIRLRPDRAKGFLNLKRVINGLNQKYSEPDGFYIEPDFARVATPRDKAHLESSHRGLHNFEARIIKTFADRIVKTRPGYLFKKDKKEKITVTYLDITLQEFRHSRFLEDYRQEHNTTRHHFTHNGETVSWVPVDKWHPFLATTPLFSFDPSEVEELMKYGLDKIKATVSQKGNITFKNRKYRVALGAEHFSRHHGTKVYISQFQDKLFIFEYKDDGRLIGEALGLAPYEKPEHQPPELKIAANEVEQISAFLEQQEMTVDRAVLIEIFRKGLTLATVESIFDKNKDRYVNYSIKLRQSPQKIGSVLFNAFILDCERHQRRHHVAPYASL